MMQIPTLTTPRIILRAFNSHEITGLHQILLNPSVLRYFPPSDPLSFAKVQRLVERQQKHWDGHGFGWWALSLADSDQLLGWCGLNFLPETNEVELKYLLAEAFWGKGIATEASKASLKYALMYTEIDPIIGLVHPENIASQRVLEKVGMSLVERKHYFGMECLRYVVRRETLESNLKIS
jgi:RimJ/RimL family protein N-acetyltransferase